MAYGLQLRDSSGNMTFSTADLIGWRLYEVLTVGATSNSSKNYTSLIPSGFTVQALVAPTVVPGGSHTVSVAGYTVSWVPYGIAFLAPYPTGNRNAPSDIYVWYK